MRIIKFIRFYSNFDSNLSTIIYFSQSLFFFDHAHNLWLYVMTEWSSCRVIEFFLREIKLKDCPFFVSSFTTTYPDPVSFFSSHLFPRISLVFFTGRCGLKKEWKKGKLERKIHRYSCDVLSLHNRHSFFRFFASESNIMTFFLTNLLWRGNNDRFPSSSPRSFDISNDKILLQTLFPRIVCIVNKGIISSIVMNPLIRERKTEQLN